MDNEQVLDDDAILGGDGELATDPTDDAILGETQEPAPEVIEAPQPEPAPIPEPALPQQPQFDERQANAFAVMQQKLNQAHQELETMRRQQEEAQRQVEAGLLGDEELGYINQQLAQRDAYYSQQLNQVQAQHSIQMAQLQADMNREQTGGWDKVLELARDEAVRQASIYGVSPEQLFATIDGSPDAGQRISALAQMARERQAAQQPVDWDQRLAQAKAEAQAEALKAFQEAAAKSPHNLAPPTVGSLPGVTVTQPRVLSDDEILAQ